MGHFGLRCAGKLILMSSHRVVTNIDQRTTCEARAKFIQYLVFIALNLLDCHDGDAARELLGKGEYQVLQWFRAFLDPKATFISDVRKPVGSTDSEYTIQLHSISLFRFLLEYCGGREDFVQHRLLSGYTANDNANMYGSVLGVRGSNPFGSFNVEKLFNALSGSSLFTTITTPQHVTQLSEALMRHLCIGFREGYLVWSPSSICTQC
jgi:hypothetical protein